MAGLSSSPIKEVVKERVRVRARTRTTEQIARAKKSVNQVLTGQKVPEFINMRYLTTDRGLHDMILQIGNPSVVQIWIQIRKEHPEWYLCTNPNGTKKAYVLLGEYLKDFIPVLKKHVDVRKDQLSIQKSYARTDQARGIRWDGEHFEVGFIVSGGEGRTGPMIGDY